MELIFEFLPIVAFFIAFKWKGLSVATVVAVISNLILLIISKAKTGKYNKIPVISFGSLVILSICAFVCKKEVFIKLKPTAIYWTLSCLFLVSYLLGKGTLIEKLNNNSIQLPKKIWNVLNFLWIIFFILMGTLNLYVVYSYDTNTWVNFKLFGTFGLTVLFILFQFVFIYKYLAKKT